MAHVFTLYAETAFTRFAAYAASKAALNQALRVSTLLSRREAGVL